MGEGHVLQDDDRVLGRVLLQQVLEVGRAGAEDHLVGLSVLALGEKIVMDAQGQYTEVSEYYLLNSTKKSFGKVW